MNISSAESQIMEALWCAAPQTAENIAATVGPANDWTEATVKTLINRLLKKRAIAADKDGRRYLYRPLLVRADYVTGESQGLLDRLFDGRLAPLVSHFSQTQTLTPQDIAELKQLIDKLDEHR